ncbi:MAG TPA: sigma-70 family RNA polymerase sigma factor [Tepidisphaeraceae bacterium]|nr:sigma-70 family RNA polymerase sigma factor [Tepidisphaeraceae bacterium]
MTVATNDRELLRHYVRSGSQAAFAQIVARHMGLVYSTCRRILRDAHLAEDASQAVFVILTRKARSIGPGTPVAGWLYSTSRYVCANLSKRERLRQRREHEAAARMPPCASSAAPAIADSSLALDRALARLARGDRNVLLLRVVEGNSLRQVGDALAISEDAAKKRVSRAIERLRQLFSAEVGSLPSMAGMAELLNHSNIPVPGGFVSTTIKAAGSPSGAAAELAGKVTTMLLYKKLAIAAAACLLLGTLATGAGLLSEGAGGHRTGQSAATPLGDTPPALDAKLHRLLPKMNFDAPALSDALHFLSDVSGVQVGADWDSIKQAGIAWDAPVKLQLGNLTLTQAMREVLWNAAPPGKLDYTVGPNGIFISTAQALKLSAQKAEVPEDATVRALLARRLKQPRLGAKPLLSLSEAIAKPAGVRLWINWPALKRAGLTPDSPISIPGGENVPVGKQLDAALAAAKSGKPVSYAVIDGLVMVSTPEDLKRLAKIAGVSHIPA